MGINITQQEKDTRVVIEGVEIYYLSSGKCSDYLKEQLTKNKRFVVIGTISPNVCFLFKKMNIDFENNIVSHENNILLHYAFKILRCQSLDDKVETINLATKIANRRIDVITAIWMAGLYTGEWNTKEGFRGGIDSVILTEFNFLKKLKTPTLKRLGCHLTRYDGFFLKGEENIANLVVCKKKRTQLKELRIDFKDLMSKEKYRLAKSKLLEMRYVY